MFLDDFTESLNKIQNAQIDARKMMLYPFWYRLPKEQAEPLTEEMFNKYISLPPRTGPPYVTKGIGSLISSDEEIKPFPLPELPPYLLGLKRRPKMRAKKEEEIRRIVREQIKEALKNHRDCYHYSKTYRFNGIDIEFEDLLQMLLNHLRLKLQYTYSITELVSTKKPREKAKRKAHKSKKK